MNEIKIDKKFASELLPPRIKDSHKGTYGKVLNIVGSKYMPGAAYLACYASLKVGAGYSILASCDDVIKAVSFQAPEIVNFSIDYNDTSLKTILDKINNSQSVLIGCGITTEPKISVFIQGLVFQLNKNNKTAIFDADALNVISQSEDILIPKGSILTPHPLELSRLLDQGVEKIQEERARYAQIAANKYNSIIVLKGHKTVIANPGGRIFINTTGNSALATAGSGDVLAGMIAGFKAQGLNNLNACILGAYLHGLAAEIGTLELTEYSFTASNLFDYIPKAISEIL